MPHIIWLWLLRLQQLHNTWKHPNQSLLSWLYYNNNMIFEGDRLFVDPIQIWLGLLASVKGQYHYYLFSNKSLKHIYRLSTITT